VVNVDPANDHVPYEVAVDTRDLVDLGEVMERYKLGPNGGTLFCLEYIEKNLDWLTERLAPLIAEGHYILFDFPGQVELFTNHSATASIVQQLTKLDYRLCAVHLVDAHYCSDAAKFMSVLLVSLTTMLKLELPHVNVLSKVDLIEQYGELPFSLEYFTEVLDLSYLCDTLDQSMAAGPPGAAPAPAAAPAAAAAAGGGGGAGAGGASRSASSKYGKLNRAMAELVEDFSLVGFVTCAVEDKESMAGVLRVIDKANGYCFGDAPLHPGAYHMTASQADGGGGGQWLSERTMDVQERYMPDRHQQQDMHNAAAAAAAAAGEGRSGMPMMMPGMQAAGGGGGGGGSAPATFTMPKNMTPEAAAIVAAAEAAGQTRADS